MKRIPSNLAALLLFTALLAGAAGAARAQTSSSTALSTLLSRMSVAATAVKSYTASVQAHIAMHTFPYLSPTLAGTYYHKEPSRNKIVFTSGLPFIAKQFSKVYPEVESPSRWEQIYYITDEGSADGVTTLKLVPKKHGRIDHIDAKVDEKTALVVSLRWNYNDGGYATLDQTYSVIQGHPLVTAQTGHFEVPHYVADLQSTFSDFKINAEIPDSVFAKN